MTSFKDVFVRKSYIMNTITLKNVFSIVVLTCMGCVANDKIKLCQLRLESILRFHGLMVYPNDRS